MHTPSSPRFALAAALALGGSAVPVAAATYTVGPSGTYATLTDVFAAVDLEPGDVVEVEGGTTYPGGIVMPAEDGGATGNPVVLRGLRVNGQRPHLVGGVNTIEFRLANHVVFEGFEVSGTGDVTTGTFRCVYHHSHDLTIRDAYIHDCPRHGVLGADQDSGSLTIEYSEIVNAGSNGRNHAIYMATDETVWPGAVFRLRFSTVRDSQFADGVEGGNLIKSRAERNEIHYNWLEGAYYHELELIGPDPNGANTGWSEGLAREDSDVVGNVIVHTAAFGAILRFGGDATGQSFGRYRFVNNTVIRRDGDPSATTTVFRLFDGIESLEAHNNVFWRDGAGGLRIVREVEADWTQGSQVHGSYNWIPQGSTFVPGNWIATVAGLDPGVVDAAALDLRPSVPGALHDAGNGAPASPAAFPFPQPLFPPAFHPSTRTPLTPGGATARAVDAVIDIGAYEAADPGRVFDDGFEG